MTRVQLLAMFPGSQVFAHSDDALDVYRGNRYVSAWRKSGAGNWGNASVECGAENENPIAPEPDHVSKSAKVKKAEPVSEASDSTESEEPAAPKKNKKKKSA